MTRLSSDAGAHPGILIVDDTPANLELLSEMLAAHGYDLRPVRTGAQALAAARAEPPDLILLDIRMPEMDGWAVCERLKADEALREIPVIFLTGVTETEEKVRAFALGAVDYVTKPFQAEEIVSRVRTHLKLLALQRQLRSQNESLERMVAARTGELERAQQQLLQLGRLKDDFLSMINHEIRTPVNGVVGIGHLLLDLCPPSEERTLYGQHLTASSQRLCGLLEDVSTITCGMQALVRHERSSLAFATLLAQVQAALPGIGFSAATLPGHDEAVVEGNFNLLSRALTTAVQLAASFSRDASRVLLTVFDDASALRLRLTLDAFSLPDDRVAEFFAIESTARGTSAAQALALAPVVAHKILTAFGGDLRLGKTGRNAGFVEVVLRKVTADA